MTSVSPTAGYRRWAIHYDSTPNPLLALETRLLAPRLAHFEGRRILDAGCGTGRWMKFFADRGTQVIGIDLSPEMLSFSSSPDRCAVGNLTRIPLRSQSFDLALCSFALSYATPLRNALSELARVARTVVVSDLHPDAMRRGWTRSFRADGNECRISYVPHTLSELDDAAERIGLRREWRIESAFGEPERPVFTEAGRDYAFAEVTDCHAVLITQWTT